jgi:putative tricarboxylic transport membrane protein
VGDLGLSARARRWALTLAALRGGWSHELARTRPSIPTGALGFVALGLLVNVAAIEFIGFILASTAMFAMIARGFGSKRPIRDAAIGFALAFVAYVGFDRILGYKIGSGLIEGLI